MPRAVKSSDANPLSARNSPRKRKRESDEETVTGEANGIRHGREVDTRDKVTPRKKEKKAVVQVEEQLESLTSTPTRRSRKGAHAVAKVELDIPSSVEKPKAKAKSRTKKSADRDEAIGVNPDKSSDVSLRIRTVEQQVTVDVADQVVEEDEHQSTEQVEQKKVRRKRKTKEEKEAEMIPLAARSVGLKMFVGAHVSMAKGLENAVTNCTHIGGNAFALFLKSQRKWENPALKDENRDAFVQGCLEHKYDAASHVLPHGSYLVNLAQEDQDRAKQAYDTFVDDLHRCEALGIKYYNFHPGTTNQSTLSAAIGRLASQLNRALAETKTVVPVLENMAGGGSVIGSRFTDLRDVIAGIEPQHQSRIGVCIDTCHAHAAGYDLRTPSSFQRVLEEFDKVVGMQYLKAFHLNDSKAPFNSKRDLHQNIGLGFLGLRAFHSVMNEPRFENMPLILETSCEVPDPADPTGKKTIEDKSIWAREIKLLESLIGMDPDSDEFLQLEQELSDKGKEERVKMQKAQDAIDEKKKKKLEREREKGQKSLLDMMGGKTKKNKAVRSPSVSDAHEEGHGT